MNEDYKGTFPISGWVKIIKAGRYDDCDYNVGEYWQIVGANNKSAHIVKRGSNITTVHLLASVFHAEVTPEAYYMGMEIPETEPIYDIF